jgi:hypothetical protein
MKQQNNIASEVDQVQIPDKAELSRTIKSYIDHCAIIADRTLQKSLTRLNAVSQLKQTLYPMVVKPGNFTIRQICQFTLLSQTHLQSVLPSVANNSYQSSLAKLTDILETCKRFVHATDPCIHD